MLQCFMQYGILINLVKCALGVNGLQFLGRHVNITSVPPVPDQVQVIWAQSRAWLTFTTDLYPDVLILTNNLKKHRNDIFLSF